MRFRLRGANLGVFASSLTFSFLFRRGLCLQIPGSAATSARPPVWTLRPAAGARFHAPPHAGPRPSHGPALPLQASFPANLRLVLVLRPTGLLQRTLSDLALKFNRDDFNMKVPVSVSRVRAAGGPRGGHRALGHAQERSSGAAAQIAWLWREELVCAHRPSVPAAPQAARPHCALDGSLWGAGAESHESGTFLPAGVGLKKKRGQWAESHRQPPSEEQTGSASAGDKAGARAMGASSGVGGPRHGQPQKGRCMPPPLSLRTEDRIGSLTWVPAGSRFPVTPAQSRRLLWGQHGAGAPVHVSSRKSLVLWCRGRERTGPTPGLVSS